MYFFPAAPSFKPEIRLRATSSEQMSQSDEHKNNFGARSCVRANLLSVYTVLSLISSLKDNAATLMKRTYQLPPAVPLLCMSMRYLLLGFPPLHSLDERLPIRTAHELS